MHAINSFNFRNWVAVAGVHACLSVVSDCSMVKKARVTNRMQDLRTEEDSLELRQKDKWSDQLGGVGHLSFGDQICMRST